MRAAFHLHSTSPHTARPAMFQYGLHMKAAMEKKTRPATVRSNVAPFAQVARFSSNGFLETSAWVCCAMRLTSGCQDCVVRPPVRCHGSLVFAVQKTTVSTGMIETTYSIPWIRLPRTANSCRNRLISALGTPCSGTVSLSGCQRWALLLSWPAFSAGCVDMAWRFHQRPPRICAAWNCTPSKSRGCTSIRSTVR